MACRREYLSWVVLFLATASAWRSCSAQSPAPAPGADCSAYIAALYPCLDYVLGTNSTPSTGCCTGLAQIVSASPLCLCEIVSSAGSSSINVTRALLLPSLCNVTTPPLSSCPASSPGSPFSATAPVSSSPALAPTPSTASSPGSPLSATAPVSSSLPPSITPALAPTPSTASSPGSPLSGITPVSSPSTTPALAPTPSTVPSPGSSMPVSAPSPMLASPVPSASSTTPILAPSPSTMPENGPSPVQSETPMPQNAPSPMPAEPGSPQAEVPPSSSPESSPPAPPVPISDPLALPPPASTSGNLVGCSASPNTVYVILSMSFVAWKLMMQ